MPTRGRVLERRERGHPVTDGGCPGHLVQAVVESDGAGGVDGHHRGQCDRHGLFQATWSGVTDKVIGSGALAMGVTVTDPFWPAVPSP